MVNLKNSILNVKDKKSKMTSSSVRNSNVNKSFDFSHTEHSKREKGIEKSIDIISKKLNKNLNSFEKEIMTNRINNLRQNKSRSNSKSKSKNEEVIQSSKKFKNNIANETIPKRINYSRESFIEENNLPLENLKPNLN